MKKIIFFTLPILSCLNLKAGPDWSQNVSILADGRSNILNLDPIAQKQFVDFGKLHAQIYPVSVTGLLPPYQPVLNIIESDSSNPLKIILDKIVQGVAGIKDFDSVLQILGLHFYPQNSDQGVYQVPYPNGVRPEYRMGFGLIERHGAKGFTFSCAACHSANLFGKTVLGMTNRFPTANDFFLNAKKLAPAVDLFLFKNISGATDAETDLMAEVKDHVARVGVKDPIQLGLDTSLAQVALSLNHRTKDDYATPSSWYELFPRSDMLDKQPADSKPAVWWTVKYKNRWLSDGSVVSGNPIFTNIIWNEVGRGVDLHELEKWLSDNPKIIDELTAAVFSSEAPKFTDFFSAEKIDLLSAKRGEHIFNNTCSRCHGRYEKAWSLPEADKLSLNQQLQTVKVIPKEQTPVIDVGTDPYRYQGMKSLKKLNELAISKKNHIVIEPQIGYVPPPLVGIWARWPYFHNNSVPSLCAVLTKASDRPQKYYAGEANDKDQDFDSDCNGYPLNEKTPAFWKQDKYLYDTRRVAMSNMGHDEGVFLNNGVEILSAQDKKDVIHFLQTL